MLGQWYDETMKLVGPWSGRQYIKVWPQYIVPNTRAVTYATPVNDFYNNALTREVTNALYGRETPKQALNKVTVEVQRDLDQVISGH